MDVKEIAVFGLGRMGKAVATRFSESGGQVIVIDKDQKVIDEIADKVRIVCITEVSKHYE